MIIKNALITAALMAAVVLLALRVLALRAAAIALTTAEHLIVRAVKGTSPANPQGGDRK